MESSILTGKIDGLYLGLNAKSIESTPQKQVRVSFAGFEGDRHAGMTIRSTSRTERYPRNTMIRNSRQVSILSVEDLAGVAADLGVPSIRAEWLGANMLVSGIPMFTLLPSGTRLYFEGDTTLVVEALNLPCETTGGVLQEKYPGVAGLSDAYIRAALKRRGIVAWVERPGMLAVGAGFEAVLPDPQEYVYPV